MSADPVRRPGSSPDEPVEQAAVVDDAYEPTAIDVARDEAVTITYGDGHVARFDLVSLRQSCPSAACRNLRDRGEVVWPRPGAPERLQIEDAEFRGAWGIALTWNDGHTDGIFPFEALRRWDDDREAPAP